MASNNNGVQQQQQQQQQQPTAFQHENSSPYLCRDCGLYFNSGDSLEVHLKYHNENLLHKWGTQPISNEETNNNTKVVTIKREFNSNAVSAAADSSESMLKKSPEYGSRATPETSANYGHPPTPQSYHSASSPYQNPDNSSFSPGFQNYQSIKSEPLSPSAHFQQSFSTYPDNQFFAIDNSQSQIQSNYQQEFPIHKMVNQSPQYRYNPYSQPQSQPQVSSSSPAFPPQPNSSPNQKQCDKCGFVCETEQLLVEHINIVHPPTPISHMPPYQQNQPFLYNTHDIKTEDDAQSEILDLDSHKVHQVYQEEEKRQNGELNGHNPHSVTAMLSSWPHAQQPPRLFLNSQEPKMFQNGISPNANKTFQQDQKMYHAHQVHPDYINNVVTTTSQENIIVPSQQHNYRPFEHVAPQPSAPVITSTQVPTNPAPVSSAPAGKGANWKSNEARRPKTYNCKACNKWFTSSGHLKRHYNTTLHKNAVKSSGLPDPANLPISSHHHPGRDNNRNGNTSPDQIEDSRSDDTSSNFDRINPLPNMLQQPSNGPYDRQPTPNMHSQPLHSPLNHPNISSLSNTSNLSNMSSGSSPNGEAGPSTITNLDPRGLLPLPSTPNHHFVNPGFNMPHMMHMDNNQYQMYPNESAPHVTQLTATSNLNTTGELIIAQSQQALPSFSQIHRFSNNIMLSYANANVGGAGPVTAPYNYYHHEVYDNNEKQQFFRDENDYKISTTLNEDTVLINENLYTPSNNNNNNNNNLSELQILTEDDENRANTVGDIKIKKELLSPPEKAHLKRDFEESVTSPVISSTVQPKQHRCHICRKSFNKACYLTQHNKTFHAGDKPYKCNRCGKRFANEKQFDEHFSKHGGDKPYKCDLCPKQFNHKTDLRRHTCLHTGNKPFSCPTCGKGFIRKDHMLKHCDTHAKKPNASRANTVR